MYIHVCPAYTGQNVQLVGIPCVCVAMDTDTLEGAPGNFEWFLQCLAVKKGDSNRSASTSRSMVHTCTCVIMKVSM